MFHILIIISGLLLGSNNIVTLNSNVVYESLESCKENLGSLETLRDLKNFTSTLKSLGYSELEIKEYKCISDTNA